MCDTTNYHYCDVNDTYLSYLVAHNQGYKKFNVLLVQLFIEYQIWKHTHIAQNRLSPHVPLAKIDSEHIVVDKNPVPKWNQCQT